MASSSRAGAERRAKGKRAPAAAPPTAPPPLARRAAYAIAAFAVVATPLVFDAASRDSFRLPKALFFELLVLASLVPLSFSWIDPGELARVWKSPAVRAVGPFVAIATLVSLFSPHVEHVHRGLAGLWIGALALCGWSAGFTPAGLRRLLRWLLLPAALLGLVAALQFHDLFQPFHFANLADTSRLAITSFAGNAGDLGAFLVLPALVAQRLIASGRSRAAAWVALALSFYGIAITQTFAAAAALAAGTLLFWSALLPRRRQLFAAGSAVVVLAAALAVSGPFRSRATEKAREVARGDWNEVLTGRLDGWRAGAWMFGEHPWTGVGAGAFRTEFVPAKEALLTRGVPFFEQQQNVVFANAHNEVVEAAAELGLPGLAALAWAVASALARAVALSREARRAESESGEAGGTRRRGAIDAGFAWAGCGVLATLAMFHFPFRIAIVEAPALVFLAWLWREEEAE